jgi:hypothetical protein
LRERRCCSSPQASITAAGAGTERSPEEGFA